LDILSGQPAVSISQRRRYDKIRKDIASPDMLETRSMEPEIMDQPGIAADIQAKFHRDLKLIHRLLGNWEEIERRLRGSGARTVIDLGCGDGALLAHLKSALALDRVIGVDIEPPPDTAPGVEIIAADAIYEELPRADVAVSVLTLHHLADEQIVALIRNASRSVKRFVCLDLVRHPLPLVLYTVFICPMLSRVSVHDGKQSIRRAFTPAEFRSLVDRALNGTRATVDHWVSPVRARQIIDIRWE
jgi:SAM-dependent methyltransferase